MKIKECIRGVIGRSIFDSRGSPTTEVEIETVLGRVISSCPSGASTGSQEALELRDGQGPCEGKGVCNAVSNIQQLIEGLLKEDILIEEQQKVDEILCKIDGSKNKSRCGANAILPISMSLARIGALEKKIPLWKYINELYNGQGKKKLPKIFFNVINGGAHADNCLFVQEIMVSFPGETPYEVLCNASSFISCLKREVKKNYGGTGVGDEGGFAPLVQSLEEALELILSAGDCAGVRPVIAIDAAASEFYKEGVYLIHTRKGEQSLTSKELQDYYLEIIDKYKLSMIEDPFDEKDYEAWVSFLPEAQKKSVMVVGDDLLVTNAAMIKQAGEKKMCNVALIKMNQIGTITETLQAVSEARAQNMCVMASHRSGETEDTFLSHLAVGIEAEYMKAGSLCRTERVCKYNELIRIFDMQ